MTIDTPRIQNKIALWSLVLGLAIGAITFVLGYRLFTYGTFFGLGLMILNYRVISLILDKMFSMVMPDIAKFLGFVSYQIRFILMVVIMFFAVTRFDVPFGAGTFVGFLVPKLIMGVYTVKFNQEAWWNERKVIEEERRDEEFKPFNPFEIDPVEEEIRKHLKL